jgi:alpha-L-fucosidase
MDLKNRQIGRVGSVLLAGVLLLTATASDAAKQTPYDGSWESLQKMPVPAWFDDGKIGIFIHWGPYSVIGYKKGGRGYSEHVPKEIYRDPKHYYPVVKERWGACPPEFGYKDIIPEFKAENWDPDAWAQLFHDVGFKYCVMTAEHHDGWANWDSDLTPWNAVDMGPHRDLVGDLGKALQKQGLKFAPSYHRERHASFFAKELYVVNAVPLDDIAEEIRRVPEAASLYGPFGISKEFVDSYVARWKEIQTKYHPDMLWIDDIPIWTRDGNQVLRGQAKPEVQYFYDQCRLLITDFMNDGAARGADVYVNNKGGNRNWPDGVGCLEKDNLKLKVIGPKWESCTTIGTSFGYLEGDTYKSIESVIHEMIEVISRNGNFLVNIGPKSDGTIVPEQMERLQAMGAWLKINGDAIYGTRYWKECDQKNEQLAFTTKGKILYAIKLAQPVEPFTLTGTAGWAADQVKSVRLLGSDATIRWTMTSQGLQITPPADLGASQYAWSFEIVTTEEQHHSNVIVRDADKALKGTKAVDLEGHDDGSVAAHSAKTQPLVPGASVILETASSVNGFKTLAPAAATSGKVTANQKTSNNPLTSLTDGKLAKGIGPVFANGIQNGAYKMDLGSVQPVAAITSWSVNYKGQRGPQNLALYGSDAATDPGWDLSTFTPLGSLDTTAEPKAEFAAASLRAADGQSLGAFRWIVWAVSPVTETGGGENTAFQELSVEFAK